MPLLTLLIGVQMAAPVAALMMTTLTGFLLLQSWQKVDFRATWRVMVAAVFGIPFGVWGLRTLPAHSIALVMGIVLVLVGLFYLVGTQGSLGARPALGIPVRLRGWAALGGAITAGGPSIVIFGTLRRLPPAEFRATLQGCFTPLKYFYSAGACPGGFVDPAGTRAVRHVSAGDLLCLMDRRARAPCHPRPGVFSRGYT